MRGVTESEERRQPGEAVEPGDDGTGGTAAISAGKRDGGGGFGAAAERKELKTLPCRQKEKKKKKEAVAPTPDITGALTNGHGYRPGRPACRSGLGLQFSWVHCGSQLTNAF